MFDAAVAAHETVQHGDRRFRGFPARSLKIDAGKLFTVRQIFRGDQPDRLRCFTEFRENLPGESGVLLMNKDRVWMFFRCQMVEFRYEIRRFDVERNQFKTVFFQSFACGGDCRDGRFSVMGQKNACPSVPPERADQFPNRVVDREKDGTDIRDRCMTDADGGHDLRCFPDYRFRGAEKQNAVEKRVADFLLNRFGRTGCILQKMNAASGIDQRVSRFGKHPPCCADIIEIVSAGNLDPCKRCGFAVLQNEAFAWIGERADTGFPDQKTLCGHLFQ